MMDKRRPIAIACMLASALSCSKAPPGGDAWPAKPEPEGTAPDAEERPGPAQIAENASNFIVLADGLRIDREKRRVEADATVCLMEGALELLVTTPDGKPHEAIFTLKPKPSQLHAALLILGFENGAPGQYGVFAATGNRMRIEVIHEKNGKEIVIPVNELVVACETDEYLTDNVFVFAGSVLSRAREDKRIVYAADFAGDVVSLASFPDEVLALSEPASSENARLMWGVDGSRLPGVGSTVVLRIEPAE